MTAAAVTADEVLAEIKGIVGPMDIEVYMDGHFPTDGYQVCVNTLPDYDGVRHHYWMAEGPTLLATLTNVLAAVKADPPPPTLITFIAVGVTQ